jgi:hypothetical protein
VTAVPNISRLDSRNVGLPVNTFRFTNLRTCLAFAACLLIGAAMLCANFHARSLDVIYSRHMYRNYTYSYGWPLTCCTRSFEHETTFGSPHPFPLSASKSSGSVIYFSMLRASLNALGLLVSLVAVWIALHRLFRSGRMQLRLSTLLIDTTAVAVSFAIVCREQSLMSRMLHAIAPSSHVYYPITWYPPWVYLPVLTAFAVMLYLLFDGFRVCLWRHTGGWHC